LEPSQAPAQAPVQPPAQAPAQAPAVPPAQMPTSGSSLSPAQLVDSCDADVSHVCCHQTLQPSSPWLHHEVVRTCSSGASIDAISAEHDVCDVSAAAASHDSSLASKDEQQSQKRDASMVYNPQVTRTLPSLPVQMASSLQSIDEGGACVSPADDDQVVSASPPLVACEPTTSGCTVGRLVTREAAVSTTGVLASVPSADEASSSGVQSSDEASSPDGHIVPIRCAHVAVLSADEASSSGVPSSDEATSPDGHVVPIRCARVAVLPPAVFSSESSNAVGQTLADMQCYDSSATVPASAALAAIRRVQERRCCNAAGASGSRGASPPKGDAEHAIDDGLVALLAPQSAPAAEPAESQCRHADERAHSIVTLMEFPGDGQPKSTDDESRNQDDDRHNLWI